LRQQPRKLRNKNKKTLMKTSHQPKSQLMRRSLQRKRVPQLPRKRIDQKLLRIQSLLC
jgi:hypothetical protein